MSYTLIDGKQIAQNIKNDIKSGIDALILNNKRVPGLAVIQVGENPASKIYVNNKKKACSDTGIHSVSYQLDSSTATSEIVNLIDQLNEDNSIDGILVQLPLPDHIDKTLVLERINPQKDVDGFHPYNIGKLLQREPFLRPCTPYGIISMLKSTNVNLDGLNAAIVGASSIVGRPMALELLLLGITPTIINSRTKNISHIIQSADIVIACVGIAEYVKGDWIKQNAIVIDVGINRTENGKLVGDVEFELAKEKASFISPVPGGVGPMTVATLMQNTLKAYYKNQK